MDQKNIDLQVLIHHSAVNFENCEMVRGDLNEPTSLVRTTENRGTVVHLAAVTHSNREENYFKVNKEGTKNLLDACNRNGVKRFIYVSSRAAHPKGGGYSESKFQAEELVKSSGLSRIILRPATKFPGYCATSCPGTKSLPTGCVITPVNWKRV